MMVDVADAALADDLPVGTPDLAVAFLEDYAGLLVVPLINVNARMAGQYTMFVQREGRA